MATSIGGNSVGYDANGNITSQTGQATGFTYNAANRMSVAYSGSSQIGSYLYDAFGNRVQKIANGSTTAFQYDPSGRMLSEMNGSSRLREYVWLDGWVIAQIEANGSVSYVSNDYLGTPKILTDSKGNVLWKRTQKPFGETLSITGTGASNLRLPGMYGDTESSIFHNGFRDYNQNNGRYYQSDPLGLRAGSNTYLYTGGIR
jgi:RHS repeat-associated protein